MKLSIIIPVFNEEKTIDSILDLVERELQKISFVQTFEIIIIDDASSDNSKEILQQRVRNSPHCMLLTHAVNSGKGAAIRSGIAKSTGNIVLIQDADLEYDPKDYERLLAPFVDGKADVVFGSRFKGEIVRVLYFWHYMGNRFLTFFSNMFTNLNLTDMETCYKAFRGDIIRNMVLVSNRFGIEPEMTAKISKLQNIRIYEVPISYFGRTYAEGKKINWKDGIAAIWCIIRFNLLTNREKSFSKSFRSYD